MVRACAVVAQTHRRKGSHEDRPGVADPQGHRAGIAGLDLEVLGGIGVDHRDAGRDVVDQDDPGLPTGQRGGHPLGVLGRGHPAYQRGFDTGGKILAVGDEHRRGKNVVLGLADQIRGNMLGIGAVVGQHRNLGRPRLGVDTDHALQQALGGGDVDVARTGDQSDRFTDNGAGRRGAVGAGLAGAVGEHGDRLSASDGVDLVDTEELAGSQDGRGGVPGERPGVVPLRRAGDGNRGHTGNLRRDHVHDDTAGVDRDPPGDVEADPVNRQPPLDDGSAGSHLRGRVDPALVLVNDPHPTNGLGQRRPHVWVEPFQSGLQDLGRHPQVGRSDPVESLPQVAQRLGPTVAHVVTDRSNRSQRRLDVELGAGQRLSKGASIESTATQVDPGDHPSSLG